MLRLFRSAPAPSVSGTLARASGSAAPAAPPGEDVDRLIDTLARIVRGYGQAALDLEESPRAEIVALADRWAEHLTLGRPRPGGDSKLSAPSGRRDLPGVRDFVLAHRERETRAATEALTALRGVLWSVVQRLGRAIPQEAASDEAARAQLERLRLAAERGSIEHLRAEADRTVGTLGQLLEARRTRERERAQELGREVQSLGERLRDAEREAALDPLTQLANRRTFDRLLEHAVSLGALTDRPGCLLVIDADRFKTVNDKHGHPAGDAVLVAIADALVRCFPRRMDCVARLGGEEMGVLLTECGREDGARLAERALAAIRALRVTHGEKILSVTVSIGLAERTSGDDAASWMGRTDRALYAAKERGRDRVVVAP